MGGCIYLIFNFTALGCQLGWSPHRFWVIRCLGCHHPCRWHHHYWYHLWRWYRPLVVTVYEIEGVASGESVGATRTGTCAGGSGGGVEVDRGSSWVSCAEPSVFFIALGWSQFAPIVWELFHWCGMEYNLWVLLTKFLLLLWPVPRVWCPDWWCICACGTPWPRFAWLWYPSSTIYMSGNSQIKCRGRNLWCNALQMCPVFSDCREWSSPSQWAQKVLHCNCAARRHDRTQKSWGSHWIFRGEVSAFILAVWLDTRGGQGKPLLPYSSLQWSVPSMSESPSLTCCAGDNLEWRSGSSCSSFWFTICTPQRFHCPVPGV